MEPYNYKMKYELYFLHFKVQHLRSLGGGTAREVVDRIMTEVITNEMAARFNWQGRGKLNKLPLSKYALSKAVKGKFYTNQALKILCFICNGTFVKSVVLFMCLL